MNSPKWLLRETVLAVQDRLIHQFGGAAGLRDAGLMDSALARPLNLFAYGNPTLHELAASYAFGLVRNHSFVDGNKRIGFAAAVLFLEINGLTFRASQEDAANVTLQLAEGTLDEAAYAQWLTVNSA